MSELEHDPDTDLDHDPATERERDVDGHETDDAGDRDTLEAGAEPTHAPKKRARLAFGKRSGVRVPRLKRETRYGLAALLSFVLLVTALLINKQRSKGKDEVANGRRGQVVMALASSPESPAEPEPESEPNIEAPSEPAPPPSKPKPKPKSKPKPKPAESASLGEPPPPLPLPDDKIREAGNESPPLPSPPESSENPPLPAPAEAGQLDPSAPKPSEPASELPLPTPATMPPVATEEKAEPAPVPEPTPGVDPVSLPQPDGSLGQQPPLPPVTAELPGPAETPAAPGVEGEAAQEPPGSPSMKSELSITEAGPSTEAGAVPGPTDPPLPTTPADVGGDQAPTLPQPELQTPPQTSAETQPPPQASTELQTPPQASVDLQTPPQASVGLPAPQSLEQQAPTPAQQAPAPASSPVGPGDVPNFDRAPSNDEASISSLGPPKIQPGEGVPIPNAGKVRSLDEALPLDAAETAVAVTGAAVSVSAKAAESKVSELEQLAPELHVVESGENFWTISRDYYGSGNYYMALWKANSLSVSAPEKLRVGQSIVIPPPEALDRSQIVPSRVGASPASPSRVSAPVRRTTRSKPNSEEAAGSNVRRSSEVELILPIDNSMLNRRSRAQVSDELDPPLEKRFRASLPRYKVRAHETLRSIARDTLNDARRADEIYELNQDILGDDPRDLVEGQILELPEDARLGRSSR